MRLLTSAILALLLLSSCRRGETFAPDAQRYSTRDGQRISLHPSGVSFLIPPPWLEWYGRFQNNLHLSRDELDRVRNGDGEWDTEYGNVVNSALPFSDCAAHVGGEGWGKEGSSFGDIQLRAYLTNLSEQEIMAKIHGQAFDSARRAARSLLAAHALAELASGTSLTDGNEGRWRKYVIQYPLWYGDYGGMARVRFYVASIESGALVFVFMGGEDEEVKDILRSASLQSR